MRRDRILRYANKPIEIEEGKKVGDLVSDMAFTGFQGRRLGEAVDIWAKMLRKKHLVIWLGVAGALVPAGMRLLIAHLIKRRMIDVLVTTGANAYHDAYEVLLGKHFLGTDSVDDVELRKLRIDRIYDLYADEKKFYKLDNLIEKDFCAELSDNYPYSSRQIMQEFGEWVGRKSRGRGSICKSASEERVPFFIHAICDSSLGFSIAFANRRQGRRIIIDHMRDVDESSRITENARLTGVVIFGGGVPKNFIQQTAVVASYQTRHDRSHNYAIQVTTDVPHWGGLSGATFEEAQSWGKYSPKAPMVSCYCDATIAMPIMVQALNDRFRKLRREVPIFHWS